MTLRETSWKLTCFMESFSLFLLFTVLCAVYELIGSLCWIAFSSLLLSLFRWLSWWQQQGTPSIGTQHIYTQRFASLEPSQKAASGGHSCNPLYTFGKVHLTTFAMNGSHRGGSLGLCSSFRDSHLCFVTKCLFSWHWTVHSFWSVLK